MNALWKSLTKPRELSEGDQKRMLILRATFSFIMAVATSALGLNDVFREGRFWLGVFFLTVGAMYFLMFSVRLRLLKSSR